MTKLVYIDVGTHFGQEFNSMFGSQWYFFWKIIRRIIGFYLLNKGEKISIKNFADMVQQRRMIKQNKENFLIYFIEANPKIINYSHVYKKAQGVFNCSLTGEDNLNIINLFLANFDSEGSISQGSSIFSDKVNVSKENYVPTIGMPSRTFFDLLKIYLDGTLDKYAVILRLNCEGVEDDVIYAAHQSFQNKLVLTMGSIEDVKECKGNVAYLNLEKYLDENSLSFVRFSSSVNTWIEAHSSINVVYKNIFS